MHHLYANIGTIYLRMYVCIIMYENQYMRMYAHVCSNCMQLYIGGEKKNREIPLHPQILQPSLGRGTLRTEEGTWQMQAF